MRTAFIYALASPDGAVRYVGKSTDPYFRLYAHLARADAGERTHKGSWLRSLNAPPRLFLLEAVADFESWEDRERAWIASLRARGHDLTNALPGGEGGATFGRLGKPWTEEHRRNYSKARKGRKVQRTAEGNAARGRSLVVAWARRHAAGTHRHSDETRRKMSLSALAYWRRRSE